MPTIIFLQGFVVPKNMNEKLKEHMLGEEDSSPFVDPAAKTVGEVKLGENSFLFPGSILEGEKSEIEVGEDNIIMNNVSVKATHEHPVEFDEGVFVSAGSRLEGCKIGENTLVGLDAVILEGSKVGKNSIVGTEAVVPEGMEIPDGKLVLGQPAEIVRDVTEEDLDKIKELRSNLMDKRDEFKMIEKRAERFDVRDKPKRPDDLWEERRNISEKEDKEAPDMEEVTKKLKEEFDESQLF